MKKPDVLSLARIVSFLSFSGSIASVFVFMVIIDFSFPYELIDEIGLFSFFGFFLSSLLCPVFLPSPGRDKPLALSIVFIFLVLLPNIILRFLGMESWLASTVFRFVIHTCSGMLIPICNGLFFMTRIKDDGGGNRTGRFGALFFALALLAGTVFVRSFSLFLGEITGLAGDPSRVSAAIFSIVGWLIVSVGVLCILCVTLLARRGQASYKGRDEITRDETNWPLIFRLVGLSVVFKGNSL